MIFHLLLIAIHYAPMEGWAAQPASTTVRAHAGVTVAQGPGGVGLTAGLESRLGPVWGLDIGVSINPFVPEAIPVGESPDPSDYYRLRHVVFFAPGIRLPHNQPDAFRWDLIARAGPAVVWSTYGGTNFSGDPVLTAEVDPAVSGILELTLQRGDWGVRLSSRNFVTRPLYARTQTEIWKWYPQVAVEAIYLF